MWTFLRLIRFPNLLIIAATQYMMRYFVLRPLLAMFDHSLEEVSFTGGQALGLQMGESHFLLLVLATVSLAAAGYVINDYFDTKSDRINKPRSVLVGTRINRRTAMAIHILLNIAGVGLGVYISFHVGKPLWGVVFFLVAGILWFYSTTYKRQFLVGNLLVALLTALVPFMVALFEIPLLNREYGQLMMDWGADFHLLVCWILGFSFFAFLTTLTREIIKDAEDFEGDRAYGLNTLPIVIGIKWTRLVIAILLALTIAALAWVGLHYLSDTLTLLYLALAVGLPLLFNGIYVCLARTPRQFHIASIIMKVVMVTGIAYSLVASYLLNRMF